LALSCAWQTADPMRVTATMVASVVVFFNWVLVFGFVRGG
jgi:hypothetical protein